MKNSPSPKSSVIALGLLAAILTCLWFAFGSGGRGEPDSGGPTLKSPAPVKSSGPVPEELTPSPGPVMQAAAGRESERQAEGPALEVERRTDRLQAPRQIPGPQLTVRVAGRRGAVVERGTVALALSSRVNDGKLNFKEDQRSALLASAELRSGLAVFDELPCMSNHQTVEVAVIAPGFEHRGKANMLKGKSLRLLPGVNEIEIELKETKPIEGRIFGPENRPVRELEIVAMPRDMSMYPSMSEIRFQALAREALRSGRPSLWQSTVTDDQGRFELPTFGNDKYWIYSLDPEWALEDAQAKSGGRRSNMVAQPRPHLMMHMPDLADAWHEQFPGVLGQYAWRMESAIEGAFEGLYQQQDFEPGDVWLRGLEGIDLGWSVVGGEGYDEILALKELSQEFENLELLWSGRIHAGVLSAAVEVDLLEPLTSDESSELQLAPERYGEVAPDPTILRVQYPDGQNALGTYIVDSALGKADLYVGADGHGEVRLVPGWGFFDLRWHADEDPSTRDLWAANYRGWLNTASVRGEGGAIAHAFVDRAARLRVHGPDDHAGEFAVRLSVETQGSWRRIDESPLSLEPIDWARLPYGSWLVERLDRDGAVIDSTLVSLSRGIASQLMGDGESSTWSKDVSVLATEEGDAEANAE